MTTSDKDAIETFSELLARRFGAEQILHASISRQDRISWNTNSLHEHPVQLGADQLPESLPCSFADVTLDDLPDEAGWHGLRQIIHSALASVVTAPYDRRHLDPVTLRGQLEVQHLFPDFIGTYAAGSAHGRVVATFSPLGGAPQDPPSSFKVVALITAFNEEDVIAQVIGHLANEGVSVVLIDNWSSDSTVERASSLLGNGLLRIERFPESGPAPTFDLASLIKHEVEVASSENADWFIHHDADEIRRSPWPTRTLRQALFVADRAGFNAVDHTQLDFQPTDDEFAPAESLEEHFRYFIPASVIAQDYRVNAWKNIGEPVDLDTTGGHSVRFAGRRVFPYNFLLKHYPIRSQAHGERKVLQERKPRWNPEERRRGWHFQYDHIRQGHQFIRSPDSLRLFDESFDRDMLVQRLAAIGLHTDPLRYSWRSRAIAIAFLRRLGLLGPVLAVQRRIRAALRRDVSLGQR